MAEFSSGQWDGSAAGYKDAADYCSACLVDLNPSGKPKEKSNCHLPVKEPGGAYNKRALGAAAAALAGARGGVKIPPDAKRKAARSLVRLYRMAGMDVPDSLSKLAG